MYCKPFWCLFPLLLFFVSPLFLAGESPEKGEKPEVAESPFSASKAKELQRAWARHLGRKVVEEVDLGGGVTMEFVLIPPGKFQMGSPEDEKDRDDDEDRHAVEITRPFYLGKYEVTQEQYEKLVDKNPS